LGANLGEREHTLACALERLNADAHIEVLRTSELYRTAPWRVVDQPEFLNGVAEIATDLTPVALVNRLLALERDLGRDRGDGARWSARTIDLDLLLYRDCVVNEPGCRVPHPHLHERAFALRPLLEIAPDVAIPGRGAARVWLALLDADSSASAPAATA